MLIRIGDQGKPVETIQQALKAAGFDVDVDGVFGRQTEKAVREFQETRSLEVDGIVGPNTLEALGLDWVTVNPQGFKQGIVRIAEQEQARWQGREETDPDMTPVLQDYYLTGVGEEVTAENLQSTTWQASNAWSATFISWVMSKAGAGNKFAYSTAHQHYIAMAKSNRENTDVENPFWAFRIDELPPEVGDIACTSRANSGATYENIDEPGFKATHCDIVVRAEPNGVVVVGGNVGNRVASKSLSTDDQGFIVLTGGQKNYFAIIKIQEF